MNEPIRKKYTIKQVAELAGVSPTTISLYLNGKLKVAPETEKRIERAVVETGYRPDMVAVSLRTQKTQTWALVVPNITNPYSAGLAEATELIARQNGFSTMLCVTQERVENEISFIKVLIDKRVDGAIFIGRSLNSEEDKEDNHINELLDAGIQVAFILRENKRVSIPSVIPDYSKGCLSAIEHLYEIGKRRIALIIGKHGHGMSVPFLKASREVSKELGIAHKSMKVLEGFYGVETAYDACIKEMASLNADAIFAMNDLMAVGALLALEDANIAVPDQVAVVGYGDTVFSRVSRLSLTSVKEDLVEMVELALQSMLDPIPTGDESKPRLTAPKGLVIRESAPQTVRNSS